MDLAVETPARCSVYRRRRPERTPLYRAVQGHLETYLALARDGHTDGDGVPQYVEGEFRRYLECGILAHGFARARCEDCGHDFLIAFSCKGRGVCPSCNARRMAKTAAHLVDQVFPPLPVRQWVLSVPKRLRYFTDAPARHSILTCLGEPTTPPEVAPARGPPLWEQAAQPLAHWEDAPAPVPEFVFDQRLSW